MSQLKHITKNKEKLQARFKIIRSIREFFWNQEFLEVETPTFIKYPAQQPHLNPAAVTIENEKNKKYSGYLHTSPEYSMKKMLTCGFSDIFTVCKCYRSKEKVGGKHNPEFTMLEWYRTNSDFYQIMGDCEDLFNYIADDLENESKINPDFISFLNKEWKRVSMRNLWLQELDIDLNNYLDCDSMRSLCKEMSISFSADDSYQDLFYRVFIQNIEENLGVEQPTIVHHYPKQMADLSRQSKSKKGYAERFELYIKGIELANAFSELTNPKRQKERLLKEHKERHEMNKELYGIDEEFVKAVKNMPESAGIALGVDRLVMLFLGCEDIEDVLALPMRLLFN